MLDLLDMTGTPVTVELVIVVAGVVGALGTTLLISANWIRRAINELRKDMDTRFGVLRTDIDDRFDKLSTQVNGLAKDHADHKVHVAESYLSKASANLMFEKLGAQVNEVGAKMETRLMRIEDRLTRDEERGR